MFENIINWLINNYIEASATFISIINIFFFIKEKPIAWILSLFSSLLFVYVYYQKGIYAFMTLQFYYIGISIYGLFYWLGITDKKGGKKEVKIKHISKKEILILVVIYLALITIIYYVLKYTVNSQVPLGDAIISSFSIVGIYMLLKKYLENWFVWIANDIFAIIFFIKQGIYGVSVLFIFYFIFSFLGYIQWRKHYKMIINS